MLIIFDVDISMLISVVVDTFLSYEMLTIPTPGAVGRAGPGRRAAGVGQHQAGQSVDIRPETRRDTQPTEPLTGHCRTNVSL